MGAAADFNFYFSVKMGLKMVWSSPPPRRLFILAAFYNCASYTNPAATASNTVAANTEKVAEGLRHPLFFRFIWLCIYLAAPPAFYLFCVLA